MTLFSRTVASLSEDAKVALSSFGATFLGDIAGCTYVEWASMSPVAAHAQPEWDQLWALANDQFAEHLSTVDVSLSHVVPLARAKARARSPQARGPDVASSRHRREGQIWRPHGTGERGRYGVLAAQARGTDPASSRHRGQGQIWRPHGTGERDMQNTMSLGTFHVC